MNPYKFPQPDYCIGACMFVHHDAKTNETLDSIPSEKLLKPNGLTLDDLQQNAEFNRVGDYLDKAAVAQKVSSSLAEENRKTIKTLKGLEKHSKKPKY